MYVRLIAKLLVVSLILSAGVGSHVTMASAQSAGAGTTTVDGEWTGYWTSFSPASRGYLYEGVIKLTAGSANSIEGTITWTLRRSPRAAEQSKIGLSAVEFVRGSYDSRTRVLRLEGYRADDANSIIGLDTYQLFLADNGTVIGGITSSHGTWQGVLSAERKP